MKLYKNVVILAGGKSSRMGEDKALLPFGTYKTLAQFQYKKLEKLFSNVYISTKENKFDFEVELIYDIHEDSSPIVALLSIFETLKVESIFLLSVDAPFVDEKVIERIFLENKEDADVVIAKSPTGEEPLCGIYKKSILEEVRKQYMKGNHKLKDLLSLVNTVRVEFTDDAPFRNLNHPDEYNDAYTISLTQASSS